METIPALRELDTGQGLPRGFGTVHLVGGNRVEGRITLTPAWVVIDKDDDSRETVCFPVARLVCVIFEP